MTWTWQTQQLVFLEPLINWTLWQHKKSRVFWLSAANWILINSKSLLMINWVSFAEQSSIKHKNRRLFEGKRVSIECAWPEFSGHWSCTFGPSIDAHTGTHTHTQQNQQTQKARHQHSLLKPPPLCGELCPPPPTPHSYISGAPTWRLLHCVSVRLCLDGVEGWKCRNTLEWWVSSQLGIKTFRVYLVDADFILCVQTGDIM